MSEDKALVPVEQREVTFEGDTLLAVLVHIEGGDTPQVYVPIKILSDALGLNWSGQFERLQRDEVLNQVSRLIRVTRINSQGGNPNMMCIPLKFVPGWLFGVNASRVKAELKEKIIRYRFRCYDALASAFLERPLPTEVSPNEAVLLQIREMGLAIARMAEQQLEIERRSFDNQKRLDAARDYIRGMNERLKLVEQQVKAGTLTEEQAREVKKRVNLIAQEYTKRDPGQKHYPGIYAALEEETGATSYKRIPPKGYEAAIEFLDGWLKTIREAADEG